MKNNPFVSVVVCTKDRADALDKYTLKYLFKQDYPNYEIIVVVDDSKDNTLQILDKYKDMIHVIVIYKSKGLSYARNLGIKYSKGDIIAFIDDDCVINKNWLRELTKPYINDFLIGYTGGKILIGNSKKVYNIKEQIYGCNMSFKKDIFKHFLFDNNIYFNKCSWHDETEFIYRLNNNNIKMCYVPKAIVRHYKLPAKYRKNVFFGAPMNKVYMYAKNENIFIYYLLLISKPNIIYKYNNLKNSINIAKGLLSSEKITIFIFIWILYSLFIKIPFLILNNKLKNKY